MSAVLAKGKRDPRSLALRALYGSVAERDWQEQVEQLLTVTGWHFLRLTDSRRQHAVGWPDLLAVKGSRLLAIECKSQRGKLTPQQTEWLDVLERAGVECHVLRPADVDALHRLVLGTRAHEGAASGPPAHSTGTDAAGLGVPAASIPGPRAQARSSQRTCSSGGSGATSRWCDHERVSRRREKSTDDDP